MAFPYINIISPHHQQTTHKIKYRTLYSGIWSLSGHWLNQVLQLSAAILLHQFCIQPNQLFPDQTIAFLPFAAVDLQTTEKPLPHGNINYIYFSYIFINVPFKCCCFHCSCFRFWFYLLILHGTICISSNIDCNFICTAPEGTLAFYLSVRYTALEFSVCIVPFFEYSERLSLVHRMTWCTVNNLSWSD